MIPRDGSSGPRYPVTTVLSGTPQDLKGSFIITPEDISSLGVDLGGEQVVPLQQTTPDIFTNCNRLKKREGLSFWGLHVTSTSLWEPSGVCPNVHCDVRPVPDELSLEVICIHPD